MEIDGISIPTAFEIPNDLEVKGISFSVPFVQFAVARLNDLIGGRSILTIANARLYDTLSQPPYAAFPDKALTFTAPPVSDEVDFEFGWTKSSIFMEADVTYEVIAGRQVTETFTAIPIG
jgi:hypothetical protein